MGFPMAFLLGFPAGFPGSSLMAFLMTPTYCSPLPTHVSCYEQPSRILQGQLIAAAPCPMHACMHACQVCSSDSFLRLLVQCRCVASMGRTPVVAVSVADLQGAYDSWLADAGHRDMWALLADAKANVHSWLWGWHLF